MSTLTNAQNLTDEVATRNLWWVALAAAATAFIGDLIVFFIAQIIFGVSLMVPQFPDNATFVPLSVGLLLGTVVVPTLGATVLLAALGRFVKRPFRIFQIIALLFLLLSFGGPLNLTIETPVKVVLSVMHVVTAFAIVFVLTRFGRKQ